MKAQANIVKNDIECLFEDFAKEKEKNDFIVINMREKFQKNKRSLTFNKSNATIFRSDPRHSAKLAAI